MEKNRVIGFFDGGNWLGEIFGYEKRELITPYVLAVICIYFCVNELKFE